MYVYVSYELIDVYDCIYVYIYIYISCTLICGLHIDADPSYNHAQNLVQPGGSSTKMAVGKSNNMAPLRKVVSSEIQRWHCGDRKTLENHGKHMGKSWKDMECSVPYQWWNMVESINSG